MMLAPREKSAVTAQNKATVAARLKQFTRGYRLTQARFASIMCVSPRTMRRWIAGETTPNGVALALFEVLENVNAVRHSMGIFRRETGAPRGQPFRRGNEFRFNDRRRKEAMQRTRAAG